MAQNVRLKYNGEVVYPRASLDNLVEAVGSTASVQVPTLDSSGKIEMVYIPDGIGGGGGTWTPIVDLGNDATVSVVAGGAYSLNVPASTNRTVTAVVSSGQYGKPAFIRVVLGAGASITTLSPLSMYSVLTANATNNCYVTFFDDAAILEKKD